MTESNLNEFDECEQSTLNADEFEPYQEPELSELANKLAKIQIDGIERLRTSETTTEEISGFAEVIPWVIQISQIVWPVIEERLRNRNNRQVDERRMSDAIRELALIKGRAISVEEISKNMPPSEVAQIQAVIESTINSDGLFPLRIRTQLYQRVRQTRWHIIINPSSLHISFSNWVRFSTFSGSEIIDTIYVIDGRS